MSADLSRTAHCHSPPGGTQPVSGQLWANQARSQISPNLADIIASGDIDRSVVPPPSLLSSIWSSLYVCARVRAFVCVCVCVCSQWHLITERTKAGGGPSGVNEIVTVNRRGSSVRDKELSRGRIQQPLSVVAPLLFFANRIKCCSFYLLGRLFPIFFSRPTRSPPPHTSIWRCPKKEHPIRSPG